MTASSDGSVRVWEIPSGKLIWRATHTDAVHYASFTPNGKQVVSAAKNVADFYMYGDAVNFDRGEAVTAVNSQIQLWNEDTGDRAAAGIVPPIPCGSWHSVPTAGR